MPGEVSQHAVLLPERQLTHGTKQKLNDQGPGLGHDKPEKGGISKRAAIGIGYSSFNKVV